MKLQRHHDLFRFIRRVRIEGTCWRWTASKNADGYGCFRWNGRMRPAHQFACAFWCPEKPNPGDEPDHLCRRRDCVNPEHLEWKSHRANVLAGTSPPAVHARKTHCKNGHAFSAANTYRDPKRHRRQCLRCKQEAYWRDPEKYRAQARKHQGAARLKHGKAA